MRLTPDQVALLREAHIAFVATTNADGSPQVSPVWIDTDGEAILFNTARGRVKWRNLRRDARVAVAVVDPANPEARTLAVSGRASLEESGALEHIDRLSRKYGGQAWEPVAGQTRVIVRIVPDRAWTPG